MIAFIKILAYERPPRKEASFSFYRNLGLQKVDPPTLHPGGLVITTAAVIYSTNRRAQECISFANSVARVPTATLREVPFDLQKLCNNDTWQSEGSIAVRRGFLAAFVHDKLPVKRKTIFRETKYLLSLAADLSKTSDVTIVSHSFRMKILEAFVDTRGDLERSPARLGSYLREDQKTFAFGTGFRVESSILEKCLD